MPPVSFELRLIRVLKGHDHQRAKRADVIIALRDWMTEEQAERTIDSAIASPTTAVTASWGNTIVYWGLENRSTVGLYKAVGSVFAKYWGPKVFGLKRATDLGNPEDPNAIVTLRPCGEPSGDWSMPDLVAFAHPRQKRTAASPREIHSLEIEQHKGFKIQSIYQAYEQGRGANYSWVFAHADHIPDRLESAAKNIGVGVVTFINPNSSVTYSTHKTAIMPKRRDVSSREREKFLKTVGLPDIGRSRLES